MSDYIEIEKRGRQYRYRIVNPESRRVIVDWEYGTYDYDTTVEQARERFGNKPTRRFPFDAESAL